MLTEQTCEAGRRCVRVVRFALAVASDPGRRFRLLWHFVAWGLAATYVIIGAGYAVGGKRAETSSHILQLLINLEGGSYRAHGFIMMILGMLLVYGIGNAYTRHARLALQLITLYSVLVACMIFGGWYVYDIAFAAPWWYVLTSFLSISLMILAPPLARARALTGEENGGDSA